MMSFPRIAALIRSSCSQLLFIGWCRSRSASQAQHTIEGTTTVKVAGTGFDDLKNAIVHWQKPTPTGMIQQSTEIVELYGDLRGRVLYHVTSVFDFVEGYAREYGRAGVLGNDRGLSPRHDSRRPVPVRGQPGHGRGDRPGVPLQSHRGSEGQMHS